MQRMWMCLIALQESAYHEQKANYKEEVVSV